MVSSSLISREAKVDNRITHSVKVETHHSIITKALEIPQPRELISRFQSPRSPSLKVERDKTMQLRCLTQLKIKRMWRPCNQTWVSKEIEALLIWE